ncbi:ATP-binding cassette domain-containing protein [Microlunatus soli]|uniref:ABC transporter n=1 Tax=Microlunatus soli TaxID=630515 RepID=A0A1H1TIU4_9ACTN|nr:ATP-binding cassette domain-containing protein [Microlunatus soli]SDS60187.1 ABC transporter [Microlunatus soli]
MSDTDLVPLRDPDQQDAATDQPGPAPTSDDVADSDLVIATGLDYGTGIRRVFAGLDFRLTAGTLGVLHGTDGSGKSTLLLALIGRAGGVGGSLRVAGHDALHGSKKLRSITTAARIGSIVDAEPKHSVADAIADRAAVDGIRTGRARSTFDELADVLELRVSPDQLVEELDSYQRSTLELALAALRPSTLMVLDDLDRGLGVADQDRLYRAIIRLMAHTGSTVVASTVEPDTIPYDAVTIDLPPPGPNRRRHTTDAQTTAPKRTATPSGPSQPADSPQ